MKAVLEWSGPAGFDEFVDIAVALSRLGSSSFDLRYTATIGDRLACVGVITYVNVKPGTHDSNPLPEVLRAKFTAEIIEI